MKKNLGLMCLIILFLAACEPPKPLEQFVDGNCFSTISTVVPKWAEPYLEAGVTTVDVEICNLTIGSQAYYLLQEPFLVAKINAWAPLNVLESNLTLYSLQEGKELQFDRYSSVTPFVLGEIIATGGVNDPILSVASNVTQNRMITIEIVTEDWFLANPQTEGEQ